MLQVVTPAPGRGGFDSADGIIPLPWNYAFVPAHERRTIRALRARDDERAAYEVRLPSSRGRWQKLGILAPASIIAQARRPTRRKTTERVAAQDRTQNLWEYEYERMQQTAEIKNLYPSCPPEPTAKIVAKTLLEWEERGEAYKSRSELIIAQVQQHVLYVNTDFCWAWIEQLPDGSTDGLTYTQTITAQFLSRVDSILELWRQTPETEDQCGS